jgi:hypothetical protein
MTAQMFVVKKQARVYGYFYYLPTKKQIKLKERI